MPFYEYECPKCGYHDEVLQKINDKPLTKCPTCGKAGLRKLMSAPVFRLKGSGWYETDFKSDKDKQRNLAGPDKEEAKSESKADAKPDASKADAPKADSAKGESGKGDSGKADSAKAESKKTESAKPATEKASKSASKPSSKPAASRAKPKSKGQ